MCLSEFIPTLTMSAQHKHPLITADPNICNHITVLMCKSEFITTLTVSTQHRHIHLKQISNSRLPIWFCTLLTVSLSCLAIAWPRSDSTLKLFVRVGKIRKAMIVISLLHDWGNKQHRALFSIKLNKLINYQILKKHTLLQNILTALNWLLKATDRSH